MERRPRSNIEWKLWGQRDPLYGVASLTGRNKRGAKPWTDEEFYAHGARNWAEYRPQWDSYGVDRRSSLEIGCGAGRITKHLAGYFHKVYAIDISREMIEYARLHINAHNVSFLMTDGSELPLGDHSVTAAFSSEVFQHFSRVAFAEHYFLELFRVLDSGGSLMIHLPVYTWPDAPRRIVAGLYRLSLVADSLKADTRRLLLRLGLGHPFMFGVKYESKYLYNFLHELGFRDIQIRFFELTEDPRPVFRSYLFARKPLGPTSTSSF